jgi:hypothetical protein
MEQAQLQQSAIPPFSADQGNQSPLSVSREDWNTRSIKSIPQGSISNYVVGSHALRRFYLAFDSEKVLPNSWFLIINPIPAPNKICTSQLFEFPNLIRTAKIWNEFQLYLSSTARIHRKLLIFNQSMTALQVRLQVPLQVPKATSTLVMTKSQCRWHCMTLQVTAIGFEHSQTEACDLEMFCLGKAPSAEVTGYIHSCPASQLCIKSNA